MIFHAFQLEPETAENLALVRPLRLQMLIHAIRTLFHKIGGIWCQRMHHSIMWPMHGRYQCRQCLRYTAIPWEVKAPPPPVSSQVINPALETQWA